MLTAEKLVERLLAVGVDTPDTIIGCSEDDIRVLEEHTRVHLPESYKSFLRVAGRCTGGWDLADDWLYPELLELTDWARRFVKGYEGDKLALPEKAFVYYRHGYEYFEFFDTATGDSELPIFSYLEEDGHFEGGKCPFWELLEARLRWTEDFRRRLLAPPSWHDVWEARVGKVRERAKAIRMGIM